MRVEIIMPQLGESVVEGTITRWLVKPGDVIQRDQAVVEVATDKADSEVPAPQGGRVEAILAGDGDTVKIGAVLCVIETDLQAAASAPTPAAPSPAPAPTPAAKPVASHIPTTPPHVLPRSPEPRPAQGAAPAEHDHLAGPDTQTFAPRAPERALGPTPEARETRKAPARGTFDDLVTSPAVRRLALEHEIDLRGLRGTGERGRITRDDVLRAASLDPESLRQPGPPRPDPEPGPVPAKGAAPASPAAPAPAQQTSARPAPPTPAAQEVAALMNASGFVPPIHGVGFKAYKLPPYMPKEGDQVVQFSRRRRLIADHMVYSKAVSPHVVTVAEIDVDKTVRLREQHKAAYKNEGISLTMVAFLCAAVVKALRELPGLNARVLEDSYVLLRDVNLGVAVDTEEGLVVPVIRRADELSMRGLARSISELAAKARAGKLTPDDLSGSSFSVSNPGAKGNLFGAAVISQPNVGILRTGEIKKRVVVVEGPDGSDVMAIHSVMYAALSYDHRIIDGVLANSFLWRVAEILRNGEFTL